MQSSAISIPRSPPHPLQHRPRHCPGGFSLDEAQPLAAELGLPPAPAQAVLAAILHWTAGRPFLTQKLCRLAWQQLQTEAEARPTVATAPDWVGDLVQRRVIHTWKAQDDPEHLRTIRDRLLRQPQRAGQLLGLYQTLLGKGAIAATSPSAALGLLAGWPPVGAGAAVSAAAPKSNRRFFLVTVEPVLADSSAQSLAPTYLMYSSIWPDSSAMWR